MIIKPTNGRVVWYTPSQVQEDAPVTHLDDKPLTAHIVHVTDDRNVNLVVFDNFGKMHPRIGVKLVQEGDTKPQGGRYCEWMEYQKGQAQKAEALEKTLARHREEQAAKLAMKPGVDPFDTPVEQAPKRGGDYTA